MAVYTASTSDNAPATDQQAYSYTETFSGDFRADAEYKAGYGANKNRWNVGAGTADYAGTATSDQTFKHARTFYGDFDTSAKFTVGANPPSYLSIFIEPPNGIGSPIIEMFANRSDNTLYLDMYGFWTGTPPTGVVRVSTPLTISANTAYWMRLQRVGHTLTASVYGVDPVANPGATPLATLTQTDQNTWGYGFSPAVGANFGATNNNLSIDDFRVVGTVDSGATWRYSAVTQRDPADSLGAAGAIGASATMDTVGYSVNTGHQTYSASVSENAQANSGPAMLPEDVGGLTYHFRADDLAGLGNGAPISSWTDKSGNGRHAVQATTALQPTVRLNAHQGRAAVRFDNLVPSPPSPNGVFNVNVYPGQFLVPPHVALGDDFTLILVTRRDQNSATPFAQTWSGPGSTAFYGAGGSPAPGFRVIYSGANVLPQSIQGGTGGGSNNLAIPEPNGNAPEVTPQVYSVTRLDDPVTPGNAIFVAGGRNGNTQYNASARNTWAQTNRTTIGIASARDPSFIVTWAHEIFEIAAWKGHITEAQRKSVVRGLMARYDPMLAEATAVRSMSSATLSDTTAATDTVSWTVIRTGTAIDSGLAYDSLAATHTAALWQMESIQGFDDALASLHSVSKALTESAPASDSTSRQHYIPPRSVSEMIPLSESAVRWLAANRNLFDSAAATDIDFALRWGYLPSLATLDHFNPVAALDAHDAVAELFGGARAAVV